MVTGDQVHFAYFLEQSPGNIDASTLPKTARDIVIARVHIVGRPLYLVERDQSGQSPSGPPLKNLFSVRLKILDVSSGNATVGALFKATFGVPNLSYSRIYGPHTPSQLGRDYFVVMYVDEDDQRRLAGFPISEAQYQQWENDVRDFERARGRPAPQQ